MASIDGIRLAYTDSMAQHLCKDVVALVLEQALRAAKRVTPLSNREQHEGINLLFTTFCDVFFSVDEHLEDLEIEDQKRFDKDATKALTHDTIIAAIKGGGWHNTVTWREWEELNNKN